MALIHDRSEAIDHILSDKIVSLEFAELILGNYIGAGISRYVFEHRIKKDCVIKIDVSAYNANIIEFNTWQAVEHSRFSKWFAPVVSMTKYGRCLIMKKVNQPSIDKYPNKIPSFFTDIKQSNFGFIGKQFVCCDYASHLLIENGISGKMKQAKWF